MLLCHMLAFFKSGLFSKRVGRSVEFLRNYLSYTSGIFLWNYNGITLKLSVEFTDIIRNVN